MKQFNKTLLATGIFLALGSASVAWAQEPPADALPTIQDGIDLTKTKGEGNASTVGAGSSTSTFT